MANHSDIPIKEEPAEMYSATHVYEKCFFCGTNTSTWHEPTNQPVCSICSKKHDVGELPQVMETKNTLVSEEQPTEYVNKAVADALFHALAGIIEIGKRDMSNPKYNGYFESAEAAIKLSKSSVSININDDNAALAWKIESMKDDSGRAGCKYGDTEYDSLSVVYGYNSAIDNVVTEIRKEK